MRKAQELKSEVQRQDKIQLRYFLCQNLSADSLKLHSKACEKESEVKQNE